MDLILILDTILHQKNEHFISEVYQNVLLSIYDTLLCSSTAGAVTFNSVIKKT